MMTCPVKVCELPACDAAPAWVAEEWGECSAQCGLGTRHREVTCRTAQGPVDDKLCEDRSKPSNQVSHVYESVCVCRNENIYFYGILVAIKMKLHCAVE